MMSQPLETEAKIEDYSCVQCGKRFNSYNNYHTHLKAKHSPPAVKISPTEIVPAGDKDTSVVKPKVRGYQTEIHSKFGGKNKGFEQYQQDLEDKIYAFLGELGEKHVDNPRESDNLSEESDRMMGQANYLENNVVRTPFELEFDVRKEMPVVTFRNLELQRIFQIFEKDTLTLQEKLLAEKDIWELRDPIDMDKYEDDEFSLINVTNVLNNYPKKGLELQHPELCVFLLWLAKICKPQAWSEFYLLVGHTLFQYQQYLNTKSPSSQKSQTSWKAFSADHSLHLEQGISREIAEYIHILDDSDALNFLKLYYKWVTFFDLF